MRKKDPVILAYFTAFAVTIYVLENLIPKPLPFFKLGLANVIVLLLLWNRKYLASIIIILSKTILGGLISGMLFSPMTVISLGASAMAFIFMFGAINTKIGFSVLGISIIGATVHNLSQLAIVNWILVHSDAVWKLMPLMLLLGLVTGLITGYLVHLMQKIPSLAEFISVERSEL